MRTIRQPRPRPALLLAAAVAAVAACGSGGTAATPIVTSVTTVTVAPSAPATATTGTRTTPPRSTPPRTTPPRTATPTTVPSTPTLVAVRAAHHRGYDRVVYEVTGAGPSSFTVRWADRLVADPSGQVVPVAGGALLVVTLRGVDAHTPAGVATAPSAVVFGLPQVLETRWAGDFEAVVTYGIGVTRRTAVHTYRYSAPARVVVDVTVP